MISDSGPRSHLEDGDLVRYRDGLMERDEQRLARIHLSGCEACTARLQGVENGLGALPSLLSVLDEPVPAGRRDQALAAVRRARYRGPAATPLLQRPMLKAAAIVALLLTVAFGTPPGRAWVGGALVALSGDEPGPFARQVLGVLGHEEPPVAVAPAPAAAPVPPPAERPPLPRPQAQRQGPAPGTSAPVPFNPGSNYVLVQVRSRQRAGGIIFTFRDTEQAVAQVVAGRRSESLEPRPDGLRVRNASTSRADYAITVPTRYRFLRVRIADEPELRIPISRAQHEGVWNIGLEASTP